MRLLVVTLVIFFLLISTTKADDFDCLVEALYHEARSESLLGMLSVANVILTRKESSNYPNTICKVVHQGKYWKDNPVRDKCHFSYWCDGRPERFTDIVGLIKSINVTQRYTSEADSGFYALSCQLCYPQMGIKLLL